jgi:hypothetical protein
MAKALRADATDLYDDPGPCRDGDQTMAVSSHPFCGTHPAECWRELLEIDRDIKHCKQQWAESRKSLRSNADVLAKWLNLITACES